ncbi:MAG: lasso RiPP family leader peptide-containing protein [Actinophytocola sp.]
MMHEDVYEVPALVEVGDFTELTLGLPWGGNIDLFDANTPIWG